MKTVQEWPNLITRHKPNFIAVHFVCVDHMEHMQGRDGQMVRRAIALADYGVGKIMSALEQADIKDSTAIIIAGDHGFVNLHSVLSPNIWLVQNGLISAEGTKKDWKAVFHNGGASTFLHLNNKNDKKTLEIVQKALESLPASKRKLFRIVERAELDKYGADPDAVLALNPIEGVSFSNAYTGADIRSAKGGTHGYLPDFKDIQTGFIGYGNAFVKGEVIPVMGLEDIAPIISQLLGLDFKAPDGVLYPGILNNTNNNKR